MALHMNKNIFSPRVVLNYIRTFTLVNYHLRLGLQCLYNCQEPRDSIQVFMASHGHLNIRVAEVLIINTAFSATRLVAFALRGANCCRGRYQLGPLVALER
jgi:hypothetical protein